LLNSIACPRWTGNYWFAQSQIFEDASWSVDLRKSIVMLWNDAKITDENAVHDSSAPAGEWEVPSNASFDDADARDRRGDSDGQLLHADQPISPLPRELQVPLLRWLARKGNSRGDGSWGGCRFLV
jgi:hypothetical protein